MLASSSAKIEFIDGFLFTGNRLYIVVILQCT